MQKMFFAALALLLAANTTQAQNANARTTQFNLDKGVAIQGYDPVAYFQDNKAEKGMNSLAVFYQGVTYYFATDAHKAAFKANPAKYEPQYGGWCAYAMGAKGEKVEINPETFKIVNDKLYLFYNRGFNNTLKTWNKDEAHLLPTADANWMKLFKP